MKISYAASTMKLLQNLCRTSVEVPWKLPMPKLPHTFHGTSAELLQKFSGSFYIPKMPFK
jgi:hypothetical protein